MAKTPYGIKGSKTKLFIGGNTVDLPADETTWTEVGRVRSLDGTLGNTWKSADATTLDDDYERVLKTIRDGGKVDATVLLDLANAGQTAMKAAEDDGYGAPYNFKIECGDKPTGAGSKPTTVYFEALVMSSTVPGINNQRIIERKYMMDIQGPTTFVAKVAA